jgi:hypothetical protein
VSDRFAAVCTSLHFLRVFTITGIQRQIFSLPGPVVSMATQGGLILVAYRQGQGVYLSVCSCICLCAVLSVSVQIRLFDEMC